MKVADLVKGLDLKIISGSNLLDREVLGGCVGDLLSVIMGKAKEGNVWVTVQGHINIIAVATLVDVSCVIVSEGFDIEEDAIQKAIEEEVILLSSPKTSFELCSELGKLGL
jgi:serine kinase of HPr protein (carbohydrate metabolism regulator)